MQRVIKVVRSTLKDLQLAIDGTIILSEVSTLEMKTYSCFSSWIQPMPDETFLHLGVRYASSEPCLQNTTSMDHYYCGSL